MVGLIAGLLLALVLNSLGYWYFQAVVFGPAIIATLIAIREREYWPVVEPRLAWLYLFPLLFFGLRFVLPLVILSPDPIIDWGKWALLGLMVSVTATAILTLKFRKWIDREWAVVSTFGVIFAYALLAINTLNTTLPQARAQQMQVEVLSSSPGGYRQGGPRISIAPVGPYASASTHFVSWDTLTAAGRGRPVCMYLSRGGLGLRWMYLSKCS